MSAPGDVVYLQGYRKRIFVQTYLKDNISSPVVEIKY
jgi:hypothetical protein